MYRQFLKEGNKIPNKFIDSTNKTHLKKIFTECLRPYKVPKSSIDLNLERALHAFRLEMKAPFDSFIKSSPKDMREIFYQILVKHFLISINSDKEIVMKENFEQITGEIENLLQ